MAEWARQRKIFETKVVAGFCAASLIVATLTATAWKLANDASDAAHLVTQTQQVVNAIAQARIDTLRIEYATQNYRLSGDHKALTARQTGIAQREASMHGLQELLANNPTQTERWHRLRTLIDQRIAVGQLIEQQRTEGHEETANAYATLAPLRETGEPTHALFGEMAQEAQQALGQRTAEHLDAQRVLAATSSAAAVLLLLLLIGTYLLVRRQLRHNENSQRTLDQARQMVRDQNVLLEARVQLRTAELREAQDHLQSIISSVPAIISYVDADRRYVYTNARFLERFAPGRQSVAGCTVREVFGEERYAKVAPVIDKVLAGEAQSWDWQVAPGYWMHVQNVPKRDAHDRVCGYYVLASDITERKQAEDKIQILNAEMAQRVAELERVTRAWKTLSAGNSAMLRATDEPQLLKSMCQAIVDAGGYSTAMVWYAVDDAAKSMRPMAECGYGPGMEALHRLQPTWGEGECSRGAIASAIRTGETQVIGNLQTDPVYQNWRSFLDGNSSCIASPLFVGHTVVGALAIFSPEPELFGPDEARLMNELTEDLAFGIASLRAKAERNKTEAAMRQLTRFDTLTGLPNETQFVEELKRAIDEAQSSPVPQSFAMLQINVERLGDINEALGFAHGDQLLREFGQRLLMLAPDERRVARLRGDEFALLLSPGGEGAALAMVDRLQAMLRQPFAIADISLDISARVGIALHPAHGATPGELLRHMGIAVAQARKLGRTHKVYAPQTVENRPKQLSLAGELRHAIEAGDMQLYLQPKVEMPSGRVLGAEALVRWKHAQHGLIPPGEFIALAEHTGMIKNLTEWVVEAAMRVCREAERRGEALPIAVNLSARNLRDSGLLDRVRLLQKSWGIPRGLLEFEITESTVMEDPEFARNMLHTMRGEGIPLYIDDFGTGYSSLAYLQKLPVECIKIDQSFVRDMSRNKEAAVIVKSTIDLAHELGRKVVAEGVETQEDWDRLAQLGCDVAQGYFIARPMPAADFAAWTRKAAAQDDVLVSGWGEFAR